ncbi:MAG: dihydroneopterin aldolase [Trebonia sp.]
MANEEVTDTVSIRDLRVATVIGVYDWERETEQALVFAVDMAADVAKAASQDDLADALDYSSAAHTVKTVVIEGKFRLIETAAERVAQRLIDDYDLTWVRVEVVKPIPSEGYTAAITIERTPGALAGTRAQPGRTRWNHGPLRISCEGKRTGPFALGGQRPGNNSGLFFLECL